MLRHGHPVGMPAAFAIAAGCLIGLVVGRYVGTGLRLRRGVLWVGVAFAVYGLASEVFFVFVSLRGDESVRHNAFALVFICVWSSLLAALASRAIAGLTCTSRR